MLDEVSRMEDDLQPLEDDYFVQNREIVVLVLQPKLRLGMRVGSSEMICWGGGEIYRQWKTT